jgi:hypothetical protein
MASLPAAVFDGTPEASGRYGREAIARKSLAQGGAAFAAGTVRQRKSDRLLIKNMMFEF